MLKTVFSMLQALSWGCRSFHM